MIYPTPFARAPEEHPVYRNKVQEFGGLRRSLLKSQQNLKYPFNKNTC